MTLKPHVFDRALLARRMRHQGAYAPAHDFLLKRVTEDLPERLAIVRRSFPIAVQLGSAYAPLTQVLRALSGTRFVIEAGLDLGETSSFAGRVLADEEALPLAEGSVDLFVSALALHFVNDLPGALIQMRRALKGDGLLLAALLGGDTLKELRAAWLAAEAEVSGGASPRVAPFADVRQLGGLLQRAGFALPVIDSDTVAVTYQTPLDMMRDVKGMGASNMLAARRRVPVTRGLLLRACEVYAQRFGLADGRVPATFEIITLTAWAPHDSQPKPLAPGSAQVSLADALAKKQRPSGE